MTSTTHPPTDPQALAEAVAHAMWSKDRATQALGATLRHVGPGTATLAMAVRADMTNGHQTCHGGFLFALADSAFAFACNSYNQATVASGCSIDFLAPAFAGDVIVAHAQELSRSGRTGLYDVTLRIESPAATRNAAPTMAPSDKPIALFRGKSYRIQGDIIAPQS